MPWPQNDVPDVAQDPQELTDQIERIQQLMEEEIARLPGELSTSDVEADDEMAMGYHGICTMVYNKLKCSWN